MLYTLASKMVSVYMAVWFDFGMFDERGLPPVTGLKCNSGLMCRSWYALSLGSATILASTVLQM
jgi:hypothetical protein